MQDWMKQNQGVIIVFVLAAAAALLALVYIPQYQTSDISIVEPSKRFTAENEARRTLAQIIGGLVILVGVFFTWLRLRAEGERVETEKRRAEDTEKNLEILRESQITDRFTKAVEQLGSESVEVRLGGIYSLERIAKDSKKDHWTIMEILTAFVRERAPASGAVEYVDDEDWKPLPPLIDLQAVLAVLGRREQSHEHSDTPRLDLTGTNLQNYKFNGCCLGKVSLYGAHLESAVFHNAQLEGAFFFEAFLQGATFMNANLKDAFFHLAHLERSFFWDAHLEQADFRGANFEGAHLDGAHLEGALLMGATGLKQEQIDEAYTDENTKLPKGIEPSKRVPPEDEEAEDEG